MRYMFVQNLKKLKGGTGGTRGTEVGNGFFNGWERGFTFGSNENRQVQGRTVISATSFIVRPHKGAHFEGFDISYTISVLTSPYVPYHESYRKNKT